MDPKDRLIALTPLIPSSFEGESVVALDCEAILGPTGPFPMTGVTHLRFTELAFHLANSPKPSLVILPLFAAGYDAIAAIEVLEDAGYVGHITVLAPDLPKPRLVERELRNLGPGLRLTLISP